MSHIVTISTRITDITALGLACQKLGLPQAREAKHHLFTTDVYGVGVILPGWTYPVVVTKEGEVKYDNYSGRWGKQEELNKLMQQYSIEKVRLEARKAGRTVMEQKLPNGSVKLVLTNY